MASALEVRDALVAALDSVQAAGISPEIYTNTAQQIVVPAVVVGPGTPWWIPDRTFGPTEISRAWNWELTVLVAHSDPESAFEQITSLADAAVAAVAADATLGGVVEYAVVDQAQPPTDQVVADSEVLALTLDVSVRT